MSYDCSAMKTSLAKFRSWLRRKLGELDALQDMQPDPQAWEEAGIIAREAANRAARLGLTDLYQPARRLPDSITTEEATAYLSTCLAGLPSDHKPSDGMLSLREAATLLGYTEKGLRKIVDRSRRARKGQRVRGPTIEFFQTGRGGPIRFRREWVEAFIDTHRASPAPEIPPTRRLQPEKSHGLRYDLLTR